MSVLDQPGSSQLGSAKGTGSVVLLSHPADPLKRRYLGETSVNRSPSKRRKYFIWILQITQTISEEKPLIITSFRTEIERAGLLDIHLICISLKSLAPNV
jgi:hypothetical protein